MKRAVTAWALAVLLPAFTGSAAAQSGAEKHGTTQSMDLAVTRYVVNTNGEHLGLAPENIRYHLARTRTEKGWRTRLTIRVSDEPPRAGGPTNPFLNGRVEIDESGVFTMFDRTGRAIELPAAIQPPPTPALAADWPGWTEVLSMDRGKRDARLMDIQQTYGPPVGLVGGSARYVRQRGEHTEELLVDVRSGLARELNIARSGALESHSTFDYTQQANGGMVRRAIRSEAVINAQGDRLVTETEFSNFGIEER